MSARGGGEPNRGAYDRETIDKILEEGFVCQIGWDRDGSVRDFPQGRRA